MCMYVYKIVVHAYIYICDVCMLIDAYMMNDVKSYKTSNILKSDHLPKFIQTHHLDLVLVKMFPQRLVKPKALKVACWS